VSVELKRANEELETVGRQVKAAWLRELKGQMTGVEAVVVAKVDRVRARDLNHLRQTLIGLESTFLMLKNSLARRTFRELGWGDLEKVLEGSCGISPVRGDLTKVCKLLGFFSKGHDGFALRGGLLKGQFLHPKDLSALAELPARELLLAQLAGLLISPVRNLAAVLQAPVRSLGYALSAMQRKKEKDRRPRNNEAESGDGREM